MNKKSGWDPRIRQEINQGIRYCKDKYGDSWREEYFNNFRMLMPRRGEFGWRFDKKYLDEPYLSPGSRESGKYNDLLGSQTTRQFRDTIQKIIEEVGATEEELTDAIEQNKGVVYAFKIFFPIYLRLRKMGYGEKDLQG